MLGIHVNKRRKLFWSGIIVGIVVVAAMMFVGFRSGKGVHPAVALNCLGGDGASLLRRGGKDFEASLYGHTYVGRTDNTVDLYVYLIGAWEPHVISLMRDLLVDVYDRKGVVLDIGANTGVHSMAVADVATEVHAVEPWPPVLGRMRTMIERNGIDNIVVHPVGYAAEEGTLPFFVPPDANLGAGSFSSDSSPEPGETIELPLVRGDADLAGVDRVDVVKIDIQGYEKPALAGLRETLTANRPFVVMELLVDHAEAYSFRSEEDLRGVYPPDYSFFVIGEVVRPELTLRLSENWTFYCWDTERTYTLRPFQMEFRDEGGVHYNLLAVPDERLEHLSGTQISHR